MARPRPNQTIVVKRPVLPLLAWTIAALVAPLVPRLIVDPSGVWAIAPEFAVGMVAVWAFGFYPVARTLQTWIAVALGLAAAALVTFEGIRAIGRASTGEDLLLYDALMIARVTVRDVQASWGDLASIGLLMAGIFATALFYAGGMALASRWLYEVRWQGPWRSLGLLSIVAAGLFLALPQSSLVLPPLAANVTASLAEWRRVEAELDAARAIGPPDTPWAWPPEVRMAIVPGHIEALRAGEHKRRVAQLLHDTGRRLAKAGWTVATGHTRPDAPGHPGLAELAMISGVRITRAPVGSHVESAASRVDALPRFFDRHGYGTAILDADSMSPSLRAFGFRNVIVPVSEPPATTGARYADAVNGLGPLRRPAFVWIRPGHARPEDPVDGLQAEFEALLAHIEGGPDHQVLWMWVGDPSATSTPDAWPIVHVIGSDPSMIEPWVADGGFRRGITPGRTSLPHASLGRQLAVALAAYAQGPRDARR